MGGGVPFQAYIVGIGRNLADGTLKPVRWECVGLPHSFLADYAAVAKEDVAAHLFASNVTSVVAIDVERTYPTLPSRANGVRLGHYLRSYGIRHILLAGVNSSYGMAWMTLYRLSTGAEQPVSPFTVEEVEAASYLIRSGLYEWQREVGLPQVKAVDQVQYQVIPLTPKVLDVAIRLARGYTEKEIAQELGRHPGTIRNQAVEVYKVFPSAKAIADRLNGPLPTSATFRDSLYGPLTPED